GAEVLRHRTDKQTPNGLHAKKHHRIVAKHPAPHRGYHCELNDGVADRGLRHHSKSSQHKAKQREGERGKVRKDRQSDTKERSIDKEDLGQSRAGTQGSQKDSASDRGESDETI